MIKKIYDAFLKSSGISTDTRKIKPDNLFFALKGPNFNANQLALEAVDSGAKMAIIDDKEYEIQGRTFLVDNVLSTLQDLARHHRQQLKIPILGITGSNGKTTTKELIKDVLQQKHKTLATQGNLNNHIGVPLTILSIDETIEIAIVEMGANRLGEIALLSSIALPTHGIITNIGKAHIGLFGGIEGVIRGKSELYDYLIKHDGVVFINENQPALKNMAKRFRSPLLYPNAGNYYHCELIEANPFVKVRTEHGDIIETHLIGRYNFDNIAAALCIGKYFEVSPEKARQAIGNYMPENNRSQIIKKSGKTIILDAYNANPSSMTAAIENLIQMRAEKKAVILADMFELGDEAPEEHRKIGELVNEAHFDLNILCGENMFFAREVCKDARYFKTRQEVAEFLKSNPLEKGYTVLIKGSRGMALEEILEYI